MAKVDTSNENSLACPKRTPTSLETARDSPRQRSNQENIMGLHTSTKALKIKEGIRTLLTYDKSKLAPMEKKNIIKKKSRSGFKLSAIYNAMGLAASATPAMKAPISSDRPK